MMVEKYRWLAGVIAAHKERQLKGRTRLQKEIKLLQRLGLPTDYQYKTHFYGPYSDGVQADVGLLESMGLVTEDLQLGPDGTKCFTIEARIEADLPEITRFEEFIRSMENTNGTVLELAATYDAFRESSDDHDTALQRLRRKKGTKCTEGREADALKLLRSLGLPAD